MAGEESWQDVASVEGFVQKLTVDLKSLGVESCDAQPSLFFSREKQIAIEVHVDDFDIAGPDEAVEELLS